MGGARFRALFGLTGVLWALACSGGGGTEADTGDGGDTEEDVAIFEVTPPAPPVLTPCPDGWEEVPPEEPGGVTTCEPWLDGGPAVLTPCPAGWREMTEPETGTAACDPWPEGGPAVLTPCPAGWREVTDSATGTLTCDPWPETGYEECTADDQAHFPGEPGCMRIGTACSPDDNWAIDLPSDRPVLFVLAGATPGGDGSRVAPFATIGEGMGGAASGTIIAVGKGAYDEAVRVAGGVTLWGACVAETVVASSVPSASAGSISAAGVDGVVRNLRVGARFPEGGTMDLRDGEISFNAVCGANVLTEGFDINRLMDNGWYHDNNGMNLDTSELPVPEVGAPIGE
jgi:hypothetical protein